MGVKERVQDEWQRRRNSFRLLGFVLQAFLRVSCAIHMLWDDWFIYSKGTSSEWEISRALHTHERNEKPKFPWRQREEEILEKSLLSFLSVQKGKMRAFPEENIFISSTSLCLYWKFHRRMYNSFPEWNIYPIQSEHEFRRAAAFLATAHAAATAVQ